MARTPKSARSKTASDDVYNARKRYARSGLRNLQRAEGATGATATKFKRLAEQDLKAALSTYDVQSSKKQNYLKEIRQLSQGLNLNLSQELQQTARVEGKQKTRAIRRSFDTLESRMRDPEVRRERQARAILSNDEIGSRILGGLVDVWKDQATVTDEFGRSKVDTSKIMPALLNYFKVDSVADMLDKLQESIGAQLYDVTEERANIYEVVKLLIQTKVADNTLVQ